MDPGMGAQHGAAPGGVAAAGPEPKRLRLRDVGSSAALESWDDFVPANTTIHIEAETTPARQNLAEETASLVDKLNAKIDARLPGVEPTPRAALQILGMYFDLNITWDSKSDLLAARIVGLLAGFELRAHSDSVRRYDNGAWRRIPCLPADIASRIESAINLARFVCSHLVRTDAAQSFDAVLDLAEAGLPWEEYKPINDYELRARHWAAALALAMGNMPWRLCAAKGNQALDSFGSWFATPLPKDTHHLNFDDATLRIQEDGGVPTVTQVAKCPSNNCYQHIAAKLSWRPADEDRQKMQTFLASSYCGNTKGRLIVDIAELLGLLNLMRVPRMIFVRGTGGNAKSMISALRHNVAGGNHFFVSPTVFTKPDEFRVQSGHFANARLVTVQECFAGVFGITTGAVAEYGCPRFRPGCPPARGRRRVAVVVLVWKGSRTL